VVLPANDSTAPAEREERLQRLVAEILELVNRAQLSPEEARNCLAHAYACTVAEQYERASVLVRDDEAQRWGRELGDKINQFVVARRASHRG